jgi:hypothetical protein
MTLDDYRKKRNWSYSELARQVGAPHATVCRRHINFINKLKRMGTKYGWPDLEIFCPGSATKSGMNEAIFIELKVKRGTMNENQRRMRDAIIDAGFAWALCRSLSDVDAFLDPLIKLKVSR